VILNESEKMEEESKKARKKERRMEGKRKLGN